MSELSEAERRDWLRLSRTENVGPVTFDQLLQRFGTAGKALAALPDLARHGGRFGLKLASEAAIDKELADGAALGAQLIATCEPEFPQALAALDPPPPLIWARGRVELLDRPCVAIVGARVASAAGQRFARGLAAELGQGGLVVVSGLARGIDAAAHEGAQPTGTVAVLGGGVDDVYPPEHGGLYQRIAETGCVVSESEPGRAAVARDFPRRNRIISGLSRAVVVVEAELRSGSLITARLAAEQGREVLAVPGSPLDPRAKGTNDLIRQGAALCEGAEDVLRALEGLRGFREPERSGYAGAPAADPDDRLRAAVAALLSPTPVSRDEIVRATGAPGPQVFAALVELAGRPLRAVAGRDGRHRIRPQIYRKPAKYCCQGPGSTSGPKTSRKPSMKLRIAVTLAALAMAGSALAQPAAEPGGSGGPSPEMKAARQAMRQACAADVKTLCDGKMGREAMMCLRDNVEKVSAPCKETMMTKMMAARRPPAG